MIDLLISALNYLITWLMHWQENLQNFWQIKQRDIQNQNIIKSLLADIRIKFQVKIAQIMLIKAFFKKEKIK